MSVVIPLLRSHVVRTHKHEVILWEFPTQPHCTSWYVIVLQTDLCQHKSSLFHHSLIVYLLIINSMSCSLHCSDCQNHLIDPLLFCWLGYLFSWLGYLFFWLVCLLWLYSKYDISFTSFFHSGYIAMVLFFPLCVYEYVTCLFMLYYLMKKNCTIVQTWLCTDLLYIQIFWYVIIHSFDMI